MFKGLGLEPFDTVNPYAYGEPFSFVFNNGVVTGPGGFSLDLNPIIAGLNESQKGFFRGDPGQLVSYVYDAWNRANYPQCYPDVTQCTQPDTNLLISAGNAIKPAIVAWGASVLSGGSGGGGSPACATVGKKPLAGQVCCTGLVKDSLGICNASTNTPPNTTACKGTWICSVPDMYLYAGIGVLALMMMKR